MKFKVGDRVRVKNKFAGLNLKGKVGKVIEVTNGEYEYGVEFDDSFSCGHDCCGKGKSRHCRYGYESELGPAVCNKKIVITSDGKTTLARLYENNKVVKSVEANCSPADEFDFSTGAKIAFDRLSELKAIKKPKFKVGDKIIGNEKANRYGITREGWIGIIEEVSQTYIKAKAKDKTTPFTLDPDCFDLYVEQYFTGRVVCTKSNYPFWTVGKIYNIKDGIIYDDDGDERSKIKSVKEFNERFCDYEFIEIKD